MLDTHAGIFGRSAADPDNQAYAAVRAARAAFDDGPWPRMDARGRGRIMLRLADLIEAEIGELGERGLDPYLETKTVTVSLS